MGPAPPAPPLPPTPLVPEPEAAVAPPAPPAPLDDDALDEAALEDPELLDALDAEEDDALDEAAPLDDEALDESPPEEEVVPLGSSFPAEHAARVRAEAAIAVRQRISASLRDLRRRSHDDPRIDGESRRRVGSDDPHRCSPSSRRRRAGVPRRCCFRCLLERLGARDKVGFIYMTDDDVPNPWDTLPACFPSLLAALE